MYSDPTAVLKITLDSVSSPWCVELFSQTLLSCFLSFQVSPVRTSVLYWAPPRIGQNKNMENTRLQWREENTVIIKCSEKVFQKLWRLIWKGYKTVLLDSKEPQWEPLSSNEKKKEKKKKLATVASGSIWGQILFTAEFMSYEFE